MRNLPKQSSDEFSSTFSDDTAFVTSSEKDRHADDTALVTQEKTFAKVEKNRESSL